MHGDGVGQLTDKAEPSFGVSVHPLPWFWIRACGYRCKGSNVCFRVCESCPHMCTSASRTRTPAEPEAGANASSGSTCPSAGHCARLANCNFVHTPGSPVQLPMHTKVISRAHHEPRTNYANTRSCMMCTYASMHVGISARPRTRTQAISDDRAPFD